MAYLVILLSLVVGPPASSQGLRTPEYKEAITEGLDLLHRLEYDEAFQSFEALARAYPDHPGPRLAGAVAIWLRELFEREDLDLDRFISSGYFTRAARLDMSEEARQAFFERIAEARELAARYLEDDPGDPDARYYLGACEGALGAFAFTIDRSLRQAMSHGKKSYEIHRAVVEEYPDFGDSYMTVGTYEYVVSNLPWYIKWIATIVGYRGSEERAFEYLLRAAEKGYFVKIDARVLLMILYVREKQHDYALEVAQQLHQRFPENFLFHLNQAQILERMERREEAAGVLTEIVRRAESGTKNYDKMPLGKIRYALGTRLVALGERESALHQFQEAARDPRTAEKERALSHLEAGQILDSMGEREEAVSHYEAVKGLDDVEDSHRVATEHLRTPYRPKR